MQPGYDFAMSMTLILWKAPVVREPEEAEALLKPFYDIEDDSSFEPSPDIAIVADELRRLYPWRDLTNEETVAAMSDEERSRYDPDVLSEIRGVEGGEPWADLPFYQTDRLLMVDVRWGADDAVIAAIVALARKFELVLYDPQGPDVFLSTDPIDELTEFPGFKIADWINIAAMVLLLTGLTYGAWLLPIGWVRWPLVVVIGFVAAAAWFVLILMMFGHRIMDADQSSKS
jgi:hypothetical protein